MRFWLCGKNTEKQQKNSAALLIQEKTRRNQNAEDLVMRKKWYDILVRAR